MQLGVEKNCQHLLTVNSPSGLYRFTRLAYGISVAPFQFQAVMDEVLKDLPGVACYLDNILIAADSKERCYSMLITVLNQLQKYNIKVRLDKCEFLTNSVAYLGHVIDQDGLKPNDDLIKAITEAPAPTNRHELKSYLGLINYYGHFIGNLSSKLMPLYDLLHKEAVWKWSKEHEDVFNQSKKWVCTDSVLTLYDPNKPLRLICDGSPRGVGAVLAHVENGIERPIAFASKTLSPAEKNYAQLEREALAIIFGIKKFHKYLYARKFELVTDHAPLTVIFGEKKSISTTAAIRLQRWAVLLSAYDYTIVYRKGTTIANADALSRLPLPQHEQLEEEANSFSTTTYFCELMQEDDIALTSIDIANATKPDEPLKKIHQFTMNGWPQRVEDPELSKYLRHRDEIGNEEDCLTLANKIIIPEVYREQIMSLLHMGHQGIVKMKQLARSYVWWPNINEQIENKVKGCYACQMNSRNIPKPSISHWPISQRKWERIHIDYAQFTYNNTMHNFLIVIDSYTKWMEIAISKSTTTATTIQKLRTIMATHGLPEVIVSDNGVQFASNEFKEFTTKNGIKHILTPPYHAASNGAAERAVQNVKYALKKKITDQQGKSTRMSLQHLVDSYLFTYRNTPHETTGRSPAEFYLIGNLEHYCL